MKNMSKCNCNQNIPIMDYGPNPFTVNIEKVTDENRNFRTTLWTGNHLQITLMCIPAGESIGLEIHPDTDQFLRFEQGEGLVQMGVTENNLQYQRRVMPGFATVVPAGTWHNIVNVGNVPIKLYSIYAPPKHKKGTIHVTKKDAEMEED
jgi:mannose-6-phosphate isomerase-like protein (cupin superfamily)